MIETIIEGAVFLYTVVITIVSYVKSKKSKKARVESNELLEKQEKKIESLEDLVSKAKIIAGIPELIVKAEKLFPSSGEVKLGPQRLVYILNEIKMQCLDAGIEFTDEYEAHIEAVLSTPQKGENNG